MHPDFPVSSDCCRLLDLGNWASGRYVISEKVSNEPAHERPDPNEIEH
jgi:endogenous inhibitor of DNA gyrase (YacG/DUF329 family)